MSRWPLPARPGRQDCQWRTEGAGLLPALSFQLIADLEHGDDGEGEVEEADEDEGEGEPAAAEDGEGGGGGGGKADDGEGGADEAQREEDRDDRSLELKRLDAVHAHGGTRGGAGREGRGVGGGDDHRGVVHVRRSRGERWLSGRRAEGSGRRVVDVAGGAGAGTGGGGCRHRWRRGRGSREGIGLWGGPGGLREASVGEDHARHVWRRGCMSGFLVQVDLVVRVLGRMLFVRWGSAFAHGGEASCELVLVLAHARSCLLHRVASVINARQQDYSEG